MRERYDVIIVGGGVAGLYAALNFDSHINVLVVAKRELTLCNSSLAQGGVAAVLDTETDSFEYHFNDTMAAGGHENRPEAVKVLVEEGPFDVRQIIELGARFDKSNGRLNMTLEGGHSRRRIVHYEDATGQELMRVLIQAARQKDNIEIAENAFVCFLDETQGGFYATILKEGVFSVVAAPYVVLATGGIGRVYKYTTNSKIATGDGMALAYELGAKITNAHYIQFHPTAFAEPGRERFLISEAVRGEGAVLLNCDMERFMHRYDEREELAPRDVVSKAIILESRRTGNERFYLDITFKSPEYIKKRFPTIYNHCLNEGVDITKQPIPVYPCQHYLMGGIDVDLNARTRVDRLYAIGECSHTGVHGKNRLASNSLLEALVFGRRAAQDIMSRARFDGNLAGRPPVRDFGGAPLPVGTRTMVREIMQRAYFVLPDLDAAEQGLAQVVKIENRLKRYKFAVTVDYCEAKNLATMAGIILREVVHH